MKVRHTKQGSDRELFIIKEKASRVEILIFKTLPDSLKTNADIVNGYKNNIFFAVIKARDLDDKENKGWFGSDMQISKELLESDNTVGNIWVRWIAAAILKKRQKHISEQKN